MSTRAPLIVLFIPTFNSGRAVSRVLEGIPRHLLPSLSKILIYDNGSEDQTFERVQEFANANPSLNLEFYRNEDNYLLGGSTALALKQAIAEGQNYLICMHSDGQADPANLDDFIKYCHEDRFDFILGSRLLPESRHQEYSWARWAANYAFALIQQPLLKQKVYDLGAFVAFNLSSLSGLPFERVRTDMGYHPNLILTMARISPRKLRIKEFPITWGKVESSNVNVFTYALKHTARLARLYAGCMKLDVDYTLGMKSRRLL